LDSIHKGNKQQAAGNRKSALGYWAEELSFMKLVSRGNRKSDPGYTDEDLTIIIPT
jgi:hypothetical protein